MRKIVKYIFILFLLLSNVKIFGCETFFKSLSNVLVTVSSIFYSRSGWVTNEMRENLYELERFTQERVEKEKRMHASVHPLVKKLYDYADKQRTVIGNTGITQQLSGLDRDLFYFIIKLMNSRDQARFNQTLEQEFNQLRPIIDRLYDEYIQVCKKALTEKALSVESAEFGEYHLRLREKFYNELYHRGNNTPKFPLIYKIFRAYDQLLYISNDLLIPDDQMWAYALCLEWLSVHKSELLPHDVFDEKDKDLFKERFLLVKQRLVSFIPRLLPQNFGQQVMAVKRQHEQKMCKIKELQGIQEHEQRELARQQRESRLRQEREQRELQLIQDKEQREEDEQQQLRLAEIQKQRDTYLRRAKFLGWLRTAKPFFEMFAANSKHIDHVEQKRVVQVSSQLPQEPVSIIALRKLDEAIDVEGDLQKIAIDSMPFQSRRREILPTRSSTQVLTPQITPDCTMTLEGWRQKSMSCSCRECRWLKRMFSSYQYDTIILHDVYLQYREQCNNRCDFEDWLKTYDLRLLASVRASYVRGQAIVARLEQQDRQGALVTRHEDFRPDLPVVQEYDERLRQQYQVWQGHQRPIIGLMNSKATQLQFESKRLK